MSNFFYADQDTAEAARKALRQVKNLGGQFPNAKISNIKEENGVQSLEVTGSTSYGGILFKVLSSGTQTRDQVRISKIEIVLELGSSVPEGLDFISRIFPIMGNGFGKCLKKGTRENGNKFWTWGYPRK